MKLQMCSVYDSVAKVFMTPFFVSATVVAQRSFADIVNDGVHPIGKNPADYTLFKLGTFDDDKGLVELVEKPEHLGNGASFVRKG